MKKIYAPIVFCCLMVFMFGMNGCSSTSALKCPDLARSRSHVPVMTARHGGAKHSKADQTATAKVEKTTPAPKKGPVALLASASEGLPINMKLPKQMAKEIDEDKFEKINAVLGQYSENKVSITRNAKGKIFFKASSAKELIKTTKAISEASKAAPIDENTASILALVGGILGIVAIGTCLIPYLHFITFLTGPGGIVLGALGLQSDRHKWALLGIILGSIGLFLAIVEVVLFIFFVPFII